VGDRLDRVAVRSSPKAGRRRAGVPESDVPGCDDAPQAARAESERSLHPPRDRGPTARVDERSTPDAEGNARADAGAARRHGNPLPGDGTRSATDGRRSGARLDAMSRRDGTHRRHRSAVANLMRLAERLFGAEEDPDPSPGWKWLARYLVLVGVLALLVFFR